MRSGLRLWSVALVTGLLGAAGCSHFKEQTAGYAQVSRFAAYPGCNHCSTPAPVVAQRLVPLPCPPPPPRCSPCPPCPSPCPPPCPPAAAGPVNPGGTVRGYEPPLAPEPTWRPSTDPGVRLAVPEPAPVSPPSDSTRLFGPEPMPPVPAAPAPPAASPPPASIPSKPPAGVGEERTTPATPPLPAGIPRFARAKNRVAAGLRPMIDGLDWLAANGYKTVLHLRAPGEDDVTDRRQFEARGLKYFSLEVSVPLTREVVEEFNHMIGDPGNQPLFVYDRDGILAGGLWYLHFRIADGASDEDARTNAARLGLKDDQSAEAKRMWLAIQQYLGGNKP
jgi:protein tyrosine phosphatase (PTP) superfamily phosphohydrolase (DUF442 family)